MTAERISHSTSSNGSTPSQREIARELQPRHRARLHLGALACADGRITMQCRRPRRLDRLTDWGCLAGRTCFVHRSPSEPNGCTYPGRCVESLGCDCTRLSTALGTILSGVERSDVLRNLRGRAERWELPAQTIFRLERPAILRPAFGLVKVETTTSCDFLVGQSQYLASFSHPASRRCNESGASADMRFLSGLARRSSEHRERLRGVKVGGSRLSASPPSAQAGLTCGMLPHHFRCGAGNFQSATG